MQLQLQGCWTEKTVQSLEQTQISHLIIPTLFPGHACGPANLHDRKQKSSKTIKNKKNSST